MTRVSRWGTPLYWPSSTRLGSTMISRTSSGRVRISSEVTIELMHDDFPAPVAPAMSTWGSSARLSSADAPEMSSPRPTASGCVSRCASGERSTSPSVTNCRLRFGTSTPIADLPGIGASRRTSGVASAYAMSLARLVMRETLTPGASSISYRVTVGPGTILVRRASTLCWRSASSS